MTTYEQIYELFFNLIEKDKDFFNYYSLTEEEALELAKKRADNYLNEAIGVMKLRGDAQVDFSDRTDEGFNFDFTEVEKMLIPRIMYEIYLNRDVAYLKTMDVNFTATEIRVFDPSNARNSFEAMVKRVEVYNAQLLDDYKNTDRKTGKHRSFNPAIYDSED